MTTDNIQGTHCIVIITHTALLHTKSKIYKDSGPTYVTSLGHFTRKLLKHFMPDKKLH